MKIFLSWSGEESRQIAEIFKTWLPNVIQAIKPYFTPDDIIKGARWHTDISKELESSTIGLIFLTPENTESQWLMFEAGALSKHLEKSKVCPICFGFSVSDLKGPLSHFQGSVFSKGEIKKALQMINQHFADNALSSEQLEVAFNKWWPDLEEKIEKLLNRKKTLVEDSPLTDRAIIEEILKLSRISVAQGARVTFTNEEIGSFIQTYYDLIDHIIDYEINEEIHSLLKNIHVYLSKLITISGHSNLSHQQSLDDALELLENG